MAEVKKYLDLAGVEVLVDQIKDHVAGSVKELADGQVATNTAGISGLVDGLGALEELVGTIPAGSEAETVIAYINEKVAEASGDASEVASDLAQYKVDNDAAVKANKDAIDAINHEQTGILVQAKAYTDTEIDKVEGFIGGSYDEENTVTAAIADAKAAGTTAQSNLEAYQTSNDAAVAAAQKTADDITTKVGTVPTKVGETDTETVVAYIDAKVAEASGDASKVASDLAAEIERATAAEKVNADAIAVLNDGSTVEGSVAYQIAQIVNENNNGSIDTLNEIAAWIVSDTTGAAKMNADIAANAKAIADEKTRAEGIEAGLQGAIDDINDEEDGILAQAKDYADGLDSAMDARVQDLEEALGSEGSVATQIENAINELDYTTAADGDYVASITQADGVIAPVYGSFHFDEAGAAAEVLGTADDEATANTVMGVKKYAAAIEEKVDAFTPITENEIKNLFTAAADEENK